MNKRTIVGSFAALLLAAVAAFAVAQFYIFAPYGGDSAVRVCIPKGSTVSQIDSILTSSLGSYGDKVITLWGMQNGLPSAAHGSYVIEPGDKAVRVARRMAKGLQTPVRLTTACFRTPGDLARRVDMTLETDSASFLAAADSFIVANGMKPEHLMAAFIPDTYEFYWTANPERVVSVMFNHRKAFWTPERVAKAAALGLTPEQVHILTSIADAETARADELGKVAQLYLNRLNKKMHLQADPTVVFATGQFAARRITRSMLDVESPYNTYKYRGLPPGPIRMVSAESLDRVLNSQPHKYLYMCAKSDFSGYHDFAETYDRHRINAARYHRALDQRGI